MISIILTCWLYLLIFILCMHMVDHVKRSIFRITSISFIVAVMCGLFLFNFTGPYGRLLVIGIEILFFKYVFPYSWFRILYITVFFEISIAASEWTVGTIAAIFKIPHFDLDNIFYSFYLIASLFFSFIYDFLFAKLYVLTINKNYPKYSWIILILPFITYYFAINVSDFFFSFQTPLEVAFIFFGLILINFIYNFRLFA